MSRRSSLSLLLLSASLTAQTATWIGSVSTAWSNPGNWAGGLLPSPTIDAMIQVASPNRPVLVGVAACRSLTVGGSTSLTVAANATLELYGNATASGPVLGSGALRVSGPNTATLTGAFGNVEVAGPCRLVAGTVLAGRLHVGNDALIHGGCRMGALVVQAPGVATIASTAAQSVVVAGDLAVAGRSTLDNQSSMPIVLQGTQHSIAGTVIGPMAIEASAADASLVLTSTLGRTVTLDIGVAFGRTVTIEGRGQGSIQARITGHGVGSSSPVLPRLRLADVTAANIELFVIDAWIGGTVTCGELRLQASANLFGDLTDRLVVDTLVFYSNCRADLPPGLIEVRRGIEIWTSNTFAPVRGETIVFREPLDDTITVQVSTGSLTRFANIRVENGASVVVSGFASNPTAGPPINNLTVVEGHAYVVSCTVGSATVERLGRLTVLPVQSGVGSVFGPTTIRGSAVFDEVTFGSATLANSLAVEGGIAVVNDGPLAVSGELRIQGGVLLLGNGVALRVENNGTSIGHLTLDGTPTTPAIIQGSNSSIYLDGTIDARSFRFSGMSARGVVVTSRAALGAPPFDFRGGHFTGGQPGGRLLELTRTSPTTLFDLDFDDVGAMFNISTPVSSAPITVVDSRGSLAGETHDDDPGGRVAWRANATNVGSITARPGINRNFVSFTTTVEEALAFRLGRSPGTALAPIPANGPGRYDVTDDGLLAGTRYTYGVQRQRLSPFSGEWQALPLTASAVPHAADEGITRFVGQNGHASIAAALNGAPPGTIVFVETGTYSGFTIDRPTRVIGDGGVVRINSPVTISSVASGDVVLDGLLFTPGTPLTITDVGAPVILRDLELRGQQSSQGLRIERCPKVALQRSLVNPSSTTVAATVHVSSCDLGVVSVTQGSRFVHAATTATSITPDATSTVTAKAGPSAILDSPAAWPSATTQSLHVSEGGIGHLYGLLLGTTHDYVDLSALLPVDMVLLLSPSTAIALPGGVLDNGGSAALAVPGPPDAASVGFAIQLQIYTLDPGTLRGRFAELRQVLLLR